MTQFKVNFSLCIPTIDRFDEFLDDYLQVYIDYKKSGIIDEIIICDENGNDYDKIMEKYNNNIPDSMIRVYKNETILGAFKNKMKVVSLATPGNFVALIDSDNFVDETYFNTAREFIKSHNISPMDNVVLSPYHTVSDFEFDFSQFVNQRIDRYKAREHSCNQRFHMLLNNGNYIITKCVYEKLVYCEELVKQAGPHDVIYKHLISFQQIPDYCIYVVDKMKYVHLVHINSLYLQTHQAALPFYYQTILPQLTTL